MSAYSRKAGQSPGRNLMIGVILVGAVLMIVAALTGKQSSQSEEWIPLNDAVREAIHNPSKEITEESSEVAKYTETAQQSSTVKSSNIVDKSGEIETAKKGSSTNEAIHPNESGSQTVDHSDVDEKSESGKLDINRATQDEFDQLKGIGPSKAQAIVEDRAKNGYFTSVDDLLRVKGIGEKLLAELKEVVVAHP
ncbi:ComEA family DNA-binding protein [Paenibacillus sp. GSMTC-2017]|uniref:ComEA family DNA-binding protein n=1 Tax=Paenibacillus sp. GSMTC-2017 TaxID=2794350 RepID=UPI0018DA044F|nr:ComEA family DNA-binding protein [Paenibacillus sp. GSMTC-2017]MBH5318168.1 ComEA family DNA-binding protein [Paenibacillus sp. GSMTC-2017]